MPKDLTLKNGPDEVYERLKGSAKAHRRSLKSEATICLQPLLIPGRVPVAKRLAPAREFRSAAPHVKFMACDIGTFKTQRHR